VGQGILRVRANVNNQKKLGYFVNMIAVAHNVIGVAQNVIGVAKNVIGVAQNVKQSKLLVINYFLFNSVHFYKGNSSSFLLINVLLCVKGVLLCVKDVLLCVKGVLLRVKGVLLC
jgi:hypothetical protein